MMILLLLLLLLLLLMMIGPILICIMPSLQSTFLIHQPKPRPYFLDRTFLQVNDGRVYLSVSSYFLLIY